jgi:hypothetical protein
VQQRWHDYGPFAQYIERQRERHPHCLGYPVPGGQFHESALVGVRHHSDDRDRPRLG